MHKKIKIRSLILVISWAFIALGTIIITPTAKAQRVAVKTNALYDAAATPNIGGEFLLSRRFSLDVNVAVNPFKFNNFRTNIFGMQAEARFYPERAMVRHFIGILALGEVHDILYKKTRDAGDALAIGPTYGYVLPLGRHWNMEAEVGVGLLKCRDFKFKQGTSRTSTPNNSKLMLAPIKLGVTFAYIIK